MGLEVVESIVVDADEFNDEFGLRVPPVNYWFVNVVR
jgi:hypothetical protein